MTKEDASSASISLSIDIICLFFDYPVTSNFTASHPPVNHHNVSIDRLVKEFIPEMEKNMEVGRSFGNEIQVTACQKSSTTLNEGNCVPFVTPTPYKYYKKKGKYGGSVQTVHTVQPRLVLDQYAEPVTVACYNRLCKALNQEGLCIDSDDQNELITDPKLMLEPFKKVANVTFRTHGDVVDFAKEINVYDDLNERVNNVLNANLHTKRELLLRQLTLLLQDKTDFRWGIIEGLHRTVLYRFLTLGHKLDEEQVAMENYVFNKCAEQDSPIHTIQTVTLYLPVGGQLDHNFVRKCRSHSANVSKSASLAKGRTWRDTFYDISIGPCVDQVNWEDSMKELNDQQFGEFQEAYDQAYAVFDTFADSEEGDRLIRETIKASRRCIMRGKGDGSGMPDSVDGVKAVFSKKFRPRPLGKEFYWIWRYSEQKPGENGMNRLVRAATFFQLLSHYNEDSYRVYINVLNSTQPRYPQNEISAGTRQDIDGGFNPTWMEKYILTPAYKVGKVIKEKYKNEVKFTHGGGKVEYIIMCTVVNNILKAIESVGTCPMEYGKAYPEKFDTSISEAPTEDEKLVRKQRRARMLQSMELNPDLNSVLEVVLVDLDEHVKYEFDQDKELVKQIPKFKPRMKMGPEQSFDMFDIKYHKESDSQGHTLDQVMINIISYDLSMSGIGMQKKKRTRRRNDGDDHDTEDEDSAGGGGGGGGGGDGGGGAIQTRGKRKRDEEEGKEEVATALYSPTDFVTMLDKYGAIRTRMLQTMSAVKDEVTDPDEASKYKKLKKPYKSMRESILNFVQYTDAWVNQLSEEEKGRSAIVPTNPMPSDEVLPHMTG